MGKVLTDQFYRGLMADPVFGSVSELTVANLIHAGLGTEYEKQRYRREERHWASIIRGKPFDHKMGVEVS